MQTNATFNIFFSGILNYDEAIEKLESEKVKFILYENFLFIA